MFAQIFNCGAAASASASMRSPPVVKAPTLSRSLSASCCFDQASSAWLCSTSKYCSSRAMISGKTARVTRIFAFFMVVSELGVRMPAEDQQEDEEADDIG